MSAATVTRILKEIDALDEPDRLKLERELAKRLEKEWQDASRRAKRVARRRKIDQAAIDRAIEHSRYGK